MKKIFEAKYNTFTIMLIIICVAVNFYGKLIISNFSIPLYGDAIGTCVAAYLCGPIVGAVCGGISNVIFALVEGVESLLFCFTGLGLGLVVGIIARGDETKNMLATYTIGTIAALTCIIISYPLNIILHGGYVQNVFGDLIVDLFNDAGISVYISEFFGEFAVEIPDKILSVFIACLVYRFLNSRKWFRDISKTSSDMEDNDAK